MRHQCEFAALLARWREAKAAGKPQCHPGQGRARKSAQKLLSGTALTAEQLSHQSCVDRSGRNPTTWLQARDAGLEVDHRLQDVAPNPTQGSPHSLGLADSPSDLSTPQGHHAVGRGAGFCFSDLGFNLRLARWSVELMCQSVNQVIQAGSCPLVLEAC